MATSHASQASSTAPRKVTDRTLAAFEMGEKKTGRRQDGGRSHQLRGRTATGKIMFISGSSGELIGQVWTALSLNCPDLPISGPPPTLR